MEKVEARNNRGLVSYARGNVATFNGSYAATDERNISFREPATPRRERGNCWTAAAAGITISLTCDGVGDDRRVSRTLFRLVVVTRRFVYTVRTTAVELFRAGNRCWPIQKWQRERDRERRRRDSQVPTFREIMVFGQRWNFSSLSSDRAPRFRACINIVRG